MLDAIDQVNRKLAQLGQGIDLDLSKIINAKVNSQLEALKQQIDNVTKAATGRSAQQASDLQKVTRALQAQLNAQIKFEKASDSKSMQLQMERYDKATKSLEQYNQQLIQQANQLPQIQRLRERLEEAQTQSSAKAAKAREDQFNKEYAQLEKVEKQSVDYHIAQLNAKYKADQEYVKWWEQTLLKRDQAEKKELDSSYKQYLADQKAYHDQAGKAEEAYYQQVRDSRLEILNLEKQLANNNLGANQKDYLQQQLAQRTAAYEQYNSAVRATVENDAKVMEAMGQTSLAHAQELDRQAEHMRQETERHAQVVEQTINRVTMVIGRWS